MINSKFNSELYEEMCEDEGIQYDPELCNEIAAYYLQQD